MPKEDGKFTYYDNLTLPMATQDIFKDLDHYYIVTISLGETRSNQLNTRDRLLDPTRGYYCDNSHPVLRRYNKLDVVGEWDLMEAFDTHWYPQDSILLQNYLTASMKCSVASLFRK